MTFAHCYGSENRFFNVKRNFFVICLINIQIFGLTLLKNLLKVSSKSTFFVIIFSFDVGQTDSFKKDIRDLLFLNYLLFFMISV